ncbi:MAG: hypothetical protein KF874_11940 [Rhizobiaceae bacterium]|nr:hypothetical protein [Rhizobiaceae bacterium]
MTKQDQGFEMQRMFEVSKARAWNQRSMFLDLLQGQTSNNMGGDDLRNIRLRVNTSYEDFNPGFSANAGIQNVVALENAPAPQPIAEQASSAADFGFSTRPFGGFASEKGIFFNF